MAQKIPEELKKGFADIVAKKYSDQAIWFASFIFSKYSNYRKVVERILEGTSIFYQITPFDFSLISRCII